jgi:hypothetical protein
MTWSRQAASTSDSHRLSLGYSSCDDIWDGTGSHVEGILAMVSKPSDMAPTQEPRASTLRLQGLANRLVRVLLAVPLVARGIGSRLVTLYVIGRKSGRQLTIPVAYTSHESGLLIGTPFAWGRNLRTGEPLQVRYKGRRRWADVQVFTEEEDVVARYAIMARDNRNFASFNRIDVDASGEPNRNDLQLAWAAGARAMQLTLR